MSSFLTDGLGEAGVYMTGGLYGAVVTVAHLTLRAAKSAFSVAAAPCRFVLRAAR